MRFGRQGGGQPTTAMLGDGELGFAAIAQALWRSKRRIVAPTLLMTAAAFIAVNLLTPRYKSEARVLVEARENIFLRPEAEKTLSDRGVIDQEGVTSQVQLVLSRDLAREVIAKLDLAQVPEFNAALGGPSPMTVLRLLGIARDPLSMTVEERVLAAYYDRISAFPVEKSRVITIEFTSADPEVAARAVNAIAETYLTLQQVAKQDQARAAGQWLSGELEKLRAKVSEAEANVEQFRAQSNLYVGTNNTSLASQQLAELNTQLSAARAQKADAETKARLIRETLSSGQAIEASEVINFELIRRLSEQRVTLQAQLAEQSSTLLGGHPRIRELSAQIANLNQQIRSEAERMVRTLEADAKIASARVDTINASLDQLKRQAASTTDQDVQLRALEREAKAQRELFESYLAKYREATARDSIAAAPADARIISRGFVSNLPYFPKKLPIILVTALATFFLSSAFVVTGALFSGGAFSAAPLQIDTAPAVPERPVAPRPSNARTRANDRLPAATAAPRTKPSGTAIDDIVRTIQQTEGARRIAVLGAARELGTTLSAIALARILARDARVVLVDLAFQSPNLDVIASDPAAPGIADLVRGQASFDSVITRDRSSRAHVVAIGRVDDPQSIMNSSMLPAALDALAQSYDYLVIDAGVPSEAELGVVVRIASTAVVVAGDAADKAVALRDRLMAVGFAHVSVLTGPPPPLEYAAAAAA